MSQKRSGRSLLLWLAAAGVAWVWWPKDTPRPSPPPPPVHLDAPVPPAPARRAGWVKYEWPRQTGAAPALAANLAARNVYVVLVGSGSMGEKGCSGNLTKMEAAKQALAEFAKALPADAQLGLAAFDGAGISERVPLAAGNRDAFLAAVMAVKDNGGTPLKAAITIGVDKLEEAARRQLGYGEYTLVVVTDGVADSGQDPAGVVGDLLERSPVAVHTIGFCIGTNHSLNQPGRTLYKSAQSVSELRAGLGAVLAEAESFDAAKFAAPK
ncbi:MAG: VWA domain-containing protein [Elusimicrobia bacterium]|nr:VWA domain-containing protein [Elusimicrobiota bacterium]